MESLHKTEEIVQKRRIDRIALVKNCHFKVVIHQSKKVVMNSASILETG